MSEPCPLCGRNVEAGNPSEVAVPSESMTDQAKARVFLAYCERNGLDATSVGGFRVQGHGSSGTVWVRGAIGFDCAAGIIPQLEPFQTLDLWINSIGGSAGAAMNIYTILKKRATCATIMSICGSAAVMFALACPRIRMDKGSFFKIHRASAAAFGHSDELRKTAREADDVTGFVSLLVMRKTGASRRTVAKWMRQEKTWSADEAKADGLVDEITDFGSVVKAMT